MNYNEEYDSLRQIAEAGLRRQVESWTDVPELLADAMEYSLMAGGKRLRPVLMLAAAEMCSASVEETLDYAVALEMIHTYSLIHDDLPGMDNDDFRRGRPSNHKVYGEGMAILAGDGLLNGAFELMTKSVVNNCTLGHAKAMSVVASAAGITGMIAGQCVDLDMEGKEADEASLSYIHANKTGKMITAALLTAGELAQVDSVKMDALRVYGESIGLAFQITDDILDIESTSEVLGKPVGSDEKNEKLTYPAMYGLDNAKLKVQELVDKAIDALKVFENNELLAEIARRITVRKN